MSIATVAESTTDVTYTMWLNQFDLTSSVTRAALSEFQAQVSRARFAETVLDLARAGKLAPELLADATYSAWLASENPKKVLAGGDWAELFRLAHDPNHEFFERLN